MRRYITQLTIILVAALSSGCSRLTPCEKNFLEGTNISKRAYLLIMDSDGEISKDEQWDLACASQYELPISDKYKIVIQATKSLERCSMETSE